MNTTNLKTMLMIAILMPAIFLSINGMINMATEFMNVMRANPNKLAQLFVSQVDQKTIIIKDLINRKVMNGAYAAQYAALGITPDLIQRIQNNEITLEEAQAIISASNQYQQTETQSLIDKAKAFLGN